MKNIFGSLEKAPEIKPIEIPANNKNDVPSEKTLFDKLKSIFSDKTDKVSEGFAENITLQDRASELSDTKSPTTITLADGTRIELPQSESDNVTEKTEINSPIQNKLAGLAREKEVSEELHDMYSPKEGYEILSETFLRDSENNIARDPLTGEARRIDFIVIKGDKIIDSIEVTSKTADKTAQSAKEDRIREAGGNYIRDNTGNLLEIPINLQTRIERRE